MTFSVDLPTVKPIKFSHLRRGDFFIWATAEDTFSPFRSKGIKLDDQTWFELETNNVFVAFNGALNNSVFKLKVTKIETTVEMNPNPLTE